MLKLQKCTLLKHAMVTADNREQFILKGCCGNIKREMPDWPIPIHNESAVWHSPAQQHRCVRALVTRPNIKMSERRRVWSAAGLEAGTDSRGPWQTRQACLLLRQLNFCPCSYGSVTPTTGSSCRLGSKSKPPLSTGGPTLV